ncbi:MAG: nucleotidyl transferase AbiEii/AbiGii toxin family protein [Desulfotignum sp.]|nr:nucleotidyl transferase AbiEii/AbiGii toxin family protein [Desulfotignum sp.]
MPDNYYSDKLYPFQDAVLGEMQSLKTGFYLTGGTALGRCYRNHRYSDDLYRKNK